MPKVAGISLAEANESLTLEQEVFPGAFVTVKELHKSDSRAIKKVASDTKHIRSLEGFKIETSYDGDLDELETIVACVDSWRGFFDEPGGKELECTRENIIAFANSRIGDQFCDAIGKARVKLNEQREAKDKAEAKN